MAMESKQSSPRGPAGTGHPGQTPPEVKLWIVGSSAPFVDLIKLVSMGSSAAGHYDANTENFRHGTLSGAFEGELVLSSEPFGTSESERTLDAFFGSLSPAITFPRANAVWTSGTRTTPSERTAYLYEMTDPDDANNPPIGLLFEVDGTRLAAVAFYRADTTTGPVWSSTTITRASMTLVSPPEPGSLSARPGITWSYSLMENVTG